MGVFDGMILWKLWPEESCCNIVFEIFIMKMNIFYRDLNRIGAGHTKSLERLSTFHLPCPAIHPPSCENGTLCLSDINTC